MYAIWTAATTQYTITFYNSTGTSSLGTQKVNSGTATALTTFSALGGTVTNSTYGWTFAGWSTSTSATSVTYTDGANITVTKNTSLYAIYKRTLTFYSGVKKATTDGTREQYYNTKGAKVSSVTSYTPATISNWTAAGYRADTTASTSSYGKATSISPAATVSNSLHAVYTRTLTISYNANSGSGTTAATTATIYLNTNATTTSSQAVTLASNNFTRTNYEFSKWAAGSTSGTQYAAGASYNPSLAYNATTFGKTMYAIWNQDVIKNYGIASSCAPSTGSYTSYAETLADAISAATANQCITLLNSITDTSSVTFNKNLKFHTNGKTLTRTASMSVNSGVTLTKEGTGTITNSSGSSYVFQVNGGNLTVSSGVLSSSYVTIGNNGTGTITISGGTVSSSNSTYYAIGGVSASAGVINISSGLVYSTQNTNTAVYVPSGTLNVSGGSIYSDKSGGTVISVPESATSTIKVSGGTIGKSGLGAYGIYNRGTGTVTMTGGNVISGDATAITNASTGTIVVSAGTVTSAQGAIYNLSTGRLDIGKSGASYHTAMISSTGSGYAAVYCGNSSSGSQAVCRLFSGTDIQNANGFAVKNFNADFGMFSGSYINCESASYYCVQNAGTTYTKASCTHDTTHGCFFGRVYVRQGYIQSVNAAIYSKVKNKEGVHFGKTDDTLYTYSKFTADGIDVSLGPLVRGSSTTTGRGVYLDNTGDVWVLNNGIIGGKKAYANDTATTTRSGHNVGNTTASDGYKYGYLNG